MAQRKKRAHIYARVSTGTQLDGQGLDVQLRLCRDYCAANQIRVLEEYVDEAVSGASLERERLEAMLGNLNDIDYIVTASTSRLWRDIYPQAMIIKAVRDVKKDIRAVDEPTFTIYSENDPNQFLVSGMIGLLNAWERLVIAQRLKRGRRARALKGLKPCGEAPYGYMWATKVDGRNIQKFIEPHPEEAPQVKKIFRAFLKVGQIRALERYLKIMDVKNRKGKPFSWQALHDMLTNDFHIGVVRHADLKVKGEHEPIISRVVFGKAKAALERASKHRKRQTVRRPRAGSGQNDTVDNVLKGYEYPIYSSGRSRPKRPKKV